MLFIYNYLNRFISNSILVIESLQRDCRQQRQCTYKCWTHITPISTRGTYIVGITHPPPPSDSQSPSHNLITDSSDTGETLLFKRPLKLQKGTSQSSHSEAIFLWDDARCGGYECVGLERTWSEATCIVIIPVSTLCTLPSIPLILNELGTCRTERALKI